jgi:hypothetical protein
MKVFGGYEGGERYSVDERQFVRFCIWQPWSRRDTTL